MASQASDLLLVIDVQNDFCPGGALAVPGGDEIVPLVNSLIAGFSHVVLTQDWHPANHSSFAAQHPGRRPFESVELPYGPQTLWPDHCVQGTSGAAFHRGLDCNHADMILRKGTNAAIDSYSAFFENDRTTPTGLTGYLRERGFQRIFCCGLATDFCVRFSVLDARLQGFDCVLIEDACRAIDLDGSLADARRDMTAAGVTVMASSELRAA